MSPSPISQETVGSIEATYAGCTITQTLGDAPPSRPEAVPPGRYKVIEMIGEGGMGVVLNVIDQDIGRYVAMKLLRQNQSDSAAAARFIAEAQITGQLEHPNVVPVHELGTDRADNIYYTMKRVEGTDLRELLRRIEAGDAPTVKQYTLNELLTIFMKVSDAVSFAHSRGIVHRDLKPANVMVGDYGEVLVLDWGIARKLSDGVAEPLNTIRDLEAHADLTQAAIGTPGFMAPEQVTADKKIAPAADIYALGGILYNILTLHKPIEAQSRADLVMKTVRGLVPHPEKRAGDRDLRHLPHKRIPSGLAAVAMRALRTRPAERYATVAELRREIEDYQSGYATQAENAGALLQLQFFMNRHKIETFLTAAAAVRIAVAAIAFLASVTQNRNSAFTFARKTEVNLQRAAKSEREAEERINELRNIAPTYHSQAVARLREHDFQAAEGYARTALELQPDEARFHNLLGRILQVQMRYDEASAAFGEALARDPETRWAQTNIQLCKDLERLAAEDESDAQIRYLLIAHCLRQKRYSEAQALRGKAQNMFAHKTFLIEKLKDTKWTYEHWVFHGYLHAGNLEIGDDESLNPLAGLVFTQLTLKHCPKLKNIDALFGTPLTRLEIPEGQVSDLSAIRCALLEIVHIHCKGIGDKQAKVFAGMPLHVFCAKNTAISDLSFLSGAPLQKLWVDNTKVVDLSPLQCMQIRDLKLADTGVSDLEPLRGMLLMHVDADRTAVEKLDALTESPITRLFVDDTKVTDFEPLRGMNLNRLSVAGTSFSDCAVLADMPLTRLNLARSKVKSLHGLESAPLDMLWIRDTAISDLTPVADSDMRVLYMDGSAVDDLTQVKDLPLEFLSFSPDRIRKGMDVIRTMPYLRMVATGGEGPTKWIARDEFVKTLDERGEK